MDNKIKVAFFQRRPRGNANFSLEHIFSDVRDRLKDRIDAEIKIPRFYNDGILTKIYNVVEAALRQSRSVNHITGEVHFLALLMRKRHLILTIPDCGMVGRKTGFARTVVKLLYITGPVKRSRFVTTISEATKEEILKYTNCPTEKLIVIPCTISTSFQPSRKEFNVSTPNILQIGTSYNKNLMRLIEALEGLACHLTIVGTLSRLQRDALCNFGIDYTNLVGLTSEELVEQYEKCDIVAFISTFEGFGLPIIEANSVERVVVTSNLSSMPEVAGEAACLVNPYDIRSIRQGIERLINDSDYRAELIDNGRQNRLRFDPDAIADSYLELYQRVSEA